MSIQVKDSYKVREEIDMMRYIYVNRLRELLGRDFPSLINEWESHNILYWMGLFKSHTKDVDFEENPKWYFTLGYWILSRFYFIFER